MNKAEEDFQKMASDIVTESMQGCGKEYYAIGNTKVLMMPECRNVLEECLKKAAAERDAKAQILKRAYCLLIAPQTITKRMHALNTVEVKYRYKYKRKQKMWAEIFRAGFEKAIIEFKAEKRKTFEQKAGMAIVDVLKKHTFRNKLQKAIKARETFIKGAYITAYINKLRKHLISHMLSRRIVSNAFRQARQRIDGKSAWEIQRAFRGYLVRSADPKRLDMVKESIT